MTKRTTPFNASRAKADVASLVACVAKPKPRRVKAVRICDDYFQPTWELPRTAAAYDAMVEQMDNAIGSIGYRTEAIRALRAIGITRPKEDKP